MNIHNDISENIKFLAKSEIRLKILNELQQKPRDIHSLVKKTHLKYSSVSSNLIKLEKNNYITRTKHNYCINPMTEIYLTTFMDFKNSVDLINDYDAFWDKHNLKQLSIESIKNITDLKDSDLIEATPVDIYRTHDTIKKQVVKSKTVKAIFPYLHPEYPKMIAKVLKNNGSFELILPENIASETIARIEKELAKKSIGSEKLKILIVDGKLDLYLTICDETMSLGLFKNDGSFDQNRILISDSEKSRNWAEELFRYVKSQVIE